MKLARFVKNEVVFCAVFAAACVSAFFVPPSPAYLDYIDWRVLATLFALMLVVAGLRDCGIFNLCAGVLCRKASSLRAVAAILVFLCFLFSMLITNDVALLTFVPFALLILSKCPPEISSKIVILQTIGANLGSMLTPLGNPQNLFLFAQEKFSAAEFFKILLPFSVVSAVLLAAFCVAMPANKISASNMDFRKNSSIKKSELLIFSLLFALCLLSVFRLVSIFVCAAICAAFAFFVNKKLFAKVDFMLILTFCAFFVFCGNLAKIDAVREFLQRAIQNREFLTAIFASQVISNVPATLLLFPFAQNFRDLLLGVNVGGLGSLVASLASLISFKLYFASDFLGKPSRGHYLLEFTKFNLIFLAVLAAFKLISDFAF